MGIFLDYLLGLAFLVTLLGGLLIAGKVLIAAAAAFAANEGVAPEHQQGTPWQTLAVCGLIVGFGSVAIARYLLQRLLDQPAMHELRDQVFTVDGISLPDALAAMLIGLAVIVSLTVTFSLARHSIALARAGRPLRTVLIQGLRALGVQVGVALIVLAALT
jgi:hypothetical protein